MTGFNVNSLISKAEYKQHCHNKENILNHSNHVGNELIIDNYSSVIYNQNLQCSDTQIQDILMMVVMAWLLRVPMMLSWF